MYNTAISPVCEFLKTTVSPRIDPDVLLPVKVKVIAVLPIPAAGIMLKSGIA